LSNLRLLWKTEFCMKTFTVLNIFLTIQDFWATLRLPWNFSLYSIYFLHSGFLSNLRLPWIHCIEYTFFTVTCGEVRDWGAGMWKRLFRQPLPLPHLSLPLPLTKKRENDRWPQQYELCHGCQLCYFSFSRAIDIARSFRLIVQLKRSIHIGKWTKRFHLMFGNHKICFAMQWWRVIKMWQKWRGSQKLPIFHGISREHYAMHATYLLLTGQVYPMLMSRVSIPASLRRLIITVAACLTSYCCGITLHIQYIIHNVK